MSSAVTETEPKPIVACTIAHDLGEFGQLVETMDTELGEHWGDLNFDDAEAFLKSPESEELEFVAITVWGRDEDVLLRAATLINTVKEYDIAVILVTKDVSPAILHQLMRLGADEFIPYPIPQGALSDAIQRISRPKEVIVQKVVEVPVQMGGAQGQSQRATRNGAVFAVHGLAGGVGASTFAINLAWELSHLEKGDNPKVLLMDLDLQFGSSATYLDLPRREVVFELLSDVASMDDEVFQQALVTVDANFQVLSNPPELLPLDLLGPEDIELLIERARSNFDYVIIDMPTTLVQWSETVLDKSDVYFSLIELDLRSAQNSMRLVRALKAEDLPYEKMKYVLNKAPKFTDISGKSRVRKMAESLEIDLEVQLPEGGKQITQSNDHGLSLAQTAPKNPLRKEIQKLAQSVHEIAATDVAA